MNYNKMCSTYLEPFLNKSINDLLYPNFNNCMTITGRLSSSNPNLQNCPSKGEMGEFIQEILYAPEGWVCVSCDYSQLEIYVQAFLANDPALTNDLLSGVDFHVKRLAYAENKSYDEVYKLCKVDKLPEWDLKRSKAKVVSYQKAYGASPEKLSKTTGIALEDVKRIFEQEDIEYPNVALFNKNVMEQVVSSKQLSRSIDLPANKKTLGKNGKKFIGSLELLPIFHKDGLVEYRQDELRHIGTYKCITGKLYGFEEVGRLDRYDRLHRGFSNTQTKNYFIQGTAADIQGASTAKLLTLLRKSPEKVKMINEIHDSKWFLIKEEHLLRICTIIKTIMEDIPSHFKEMLDIEVPFKFPIDIKVGKNFSDMEVIKL